MKFSAGNVGCCVLRDAATGRVVIEDSPPPKIDANITTYSMDTPVEQIPKSATSINTISPLQEVGQVHGGEGSGERRCRSRCSSSSSICGSGGGGGGGGGATSGGAFACKSTMRRDGDAMVTYLKRRPFSCHGSF